MLESGWLRARSCCGTVSSLTDVWVREPAYGSKSAEQRFTGPPRAAAVSSLGGSHYRQNSLTAALYTTGGTGYPGNVYLMARAAGGRWCAMCIIRNWCTTKGFWAPNGVDGMGETGKPGANKPPHASHNKPPNFLQLWPLILAHFHLLIGVLGEKHVTRGKRYISISKAKKYF